MRKSKVWIITIIGLITLFLVLFIISRFFETVAEHGPAFSKSAAESEENGVLISIYRLPEDQKSKLKSLLGKNKYPTDDLSFWMEQKWRNENVLMIPYISEQRARERQREVLVRLQLLQELNEA